MFETLLIANRGEIACRIMRSAKRLGIRTVAVYSDADQDALHVRSADVAVRIGPAAAKDSYLNMAAIVQAAVASGAAAIHPGYGFLSENADFADACVAAGLTFVGPAAQSIRSMGSKIEAKRRVSAAGTAVVPGYHGEAQDDATLSAAALEVGFPLLIKASAGGGGKGMRVVTDQAGFASALASARREALAAFGDEQVLLERYLSAPKHIEVQILADNHGTTLHLFERDCSVQRRHQKVIEEAPAPGVDAALRARLGLAAVTAARAIDYRGAGTIEFIAQGDAFFFMEMNTRLQVEHPVTEAITGLDLVEWQLRIAAGEALPFKQDELVPQGHALEVRVYAENPARRFLPSTGRLQHLRFPARARVDTGVEEGCEVSVHYDPMLAKIITHGHDRNDAITKMIAALNATEIAGIEHNVGYLRRLADHPAFRAGDYTTGLADQVHAEVVPEVGLADWLLAGLVSLGSGKGPWSVADGFRLNQPREVSVYLRHQKTTQRLRLLDDTVELEGASATVARIRRSSTSIEAQMDGVVQLAGYKCIGDRIYLFRQGHTATFVLPDRHVSAVDQRAAAGDLITSPMPGLVIRVVVAKGARIAPGDLLMIVEAMKMEHEIRAPRSGTVTELLCAVGSKVDDGQELIRLENLARP